MASLPVVATQVGEVAEILNHGIAGLLVSPSNPNEFAKAMLHILRSDDVAKQYAEKLHSRVMASYTTDSVINSICEVYEQIR